MQKPEPASFVRHRAQPNKREPPQQIEGATDIRLDKVPGAVDRAVDVALRREMDDRPRPVLPEQPLHQHAVVDVSADKNMVGSALQALKVAEVAGVGQLVQIDDGLTGLSQPVEYEVGADESGATGHEEGHSGKEEPC